MLARKIFLQNKFAPPKNATKQHLPHEKKKIDKKKEARFAEDKENVAGLGNRIMNTVDMTKKIRKTSPKKIHENKITRECFHGVPVYRDSELGFDQELRNLVQPQRIDNDVDTDEEQVE